MRKYLFVGAAIAALAAIPATAQPARQGPMAQPLTRAAVQANVQARFARVDTNRDGYVTRDEAEARAGEARQRMEQRRGPRAERRAERRGNRGGDRMAARFDRIDTNNDGSISRSEFDAHAGARADRRSARGGEGRRGMRNARMMRGQRMGGGFGGGFGLAAFERLDGDRDGRVSLAEATARALSMFDRADANRDGTVTMEERRAVRQNFRQDRRGRGRG